MILQTGHRQQSGWDRDDAEAEQHHHRRQQPSKRGLGNVIAVSDGRHGDDGPVHAIGHSLELGVWVDAFNHKDEVAQHHLQHDDEKQIHGNRAGIAAQGLPHSPCFIDKTEQLENTQNSAEFEHPEQNFTAHLRHEEEQHCCEINKPIKTEEISFRYRFQWILLPFTKSSFSKSK